MAFLPHGGRNHPCVIEVRDSSWDNPETLEAFAQRNVAFCNIDQPLLGKSLGPTEHVTAAIAYVRLHGRNYDQWFDSDNRNDRYAEPLAHRPHPLHVENGRRAWLGARPNGPLASLASISPFTSSTPIS